jgi:hypothetical protein
VMVVFSFHNDSTIDFGLIFGFIFSNCHFFIETEAFVPKKVVPYKGNHFSSEGEF